MWHKAWLVALNYLFIKIRKNNMKLSARNKLKGKIITVDEGLITAKVTLDLGNGNVISSIISKDSIGDLNLKSGDTAYAVIKSTEVIIGIPCNCDNSECDCK